MNALANIIRQAQPIRDLKEVQVGDLILSSHSTCYWVVSKLFQRDCWQLALKTTGGKTRVVYLWCSTIIRGPGDYIEVHDFKAVDAKIYRPKIADVPANIRQAASEARGDKTKKVPALPVMA